MSTKIPNLGKLQDISELFLGTGYISDTTDVQSEAEVDVVDVGKERVKKRKREEEECVVDDDVGMDLTCA